MITIGLGGLTNFVESFAKTHTEESYENYVASKYGPHGSLRRSLYKHIKGKCAPRLYLITISQPWLATHPSTSQPLAMHPPAPHPGHTSLSPPPWPHTHLSHNCDHIPSVASFLTTTDWLHMVPAGCVRGGPTQNRQIFYSSGIVCVVRPGGEGEWPVGVSRLFVSHVST